MKKTIITLLLSAFVFSSFAVDGFLTDLKNTAGKKDKLLVIFYKPDCHYCQSMDKVASNDPLFREKITLNFNVQIFDITSSEGRLMADKFNVHVVPTMVNFNITDGNFTVIKGFAGTKKLLILLGLAETEKIANNISIPIINNTANKNLPGICGNGTVESPEGCDDGNITAGDGCNAVCNVEVGFICVGSPSICSTVCGDGVVASGEGCDDGNLTAGDGCNSICNIEPGFNCTGSPSVCFSVCGDGIVAAGEGCDDGNTTVGDGCNSVCNIEPGFICMGSPSVCSNAPPPNDECAGAVTITGSGGTANGQNETATNSAGVPVPCQSNINKDVWYQFTLAGTKNIRLEANGPSVADPILVVYSGTCGALTQVACDDDSGPGNYSLIQATLNAGTYYVRIGTYNTTATGTFSLVYNLNLAGICGNNIIEAGEQCDDGNTTNGDNCSSTCTVENTATIKGVSVNEDATPAHPSAMLDVKSFDRGVLIPRMNSSQRTAIAAPAKGLVVFDITTNTFWFYNGSTWIELVGGSGGGTGSGLPAGTANETLRNNGTTWLPNSVLQNDGTNVTITGQVKINGGSPASGKVLTSDASGLGSWISPSYDSSKNTGFGAGNFSAQSFSSTFIPTAPTESYDDGNNFASNVFTVPATGLYHFTSEAFFNFTAVTAQTTLRVIIETTGSAAYGENSVIIPAGYTGFFALQAVANAKLSAGTQMRVRIWIIGTPGTQSLSTFKLEGYRIY